MYRYVGFRCLGAVSVLGVAQHMPNHLGGRIASTCFAFAVLAQLIVLGLVVGTTAGIRSYRVLRFRWSSTGLRRLWPSHQAPRQ